LGCCDAVVEQQRASAKEPYVLVVGKDGDGALDLGQRLGGLTRE